jgi:outer membrane protein insertion porin family
MQVKGASRLKPEQIITASGLKIGQFAGEEDFKRSVNKLGDTGLFTDLTYSYQYSSAGCTLEFQITENDKLLPIVFDNFVWFSDDELLGLLRTRLPLFDGVLPVGGDLADQAADALNAILTERKITGKAEYLRAATENGPIDSYLYKVNFRAILVRNMDFPGAAPAELPALQAVAKPLEGQDYLRVKMRYQERMNFLPVYRSRGYLKATFADAQAKVAEDGARTLVDVSFPVTPGVQYKLTDIQWAGNAAMPVDKLQPLVHLKTSDPANAVQLDQDLEEVHKLYGTKGYLLAHVTAAPETDDVQSTVRYQLNVSEGDLYHMGDLTIDGLDPESSKKMAAQWQMKRGDPFDSSYLTRFFKIMYRDVGLKGSWNVVPRQSISQQDKTVSVTLHFMQKG